jgi:hypothetical protein
LSERPYPYGPPAPQPAWRISHAKSTTGDRPNEPGADGHELVRSTDTEREVDASERSAETHSSDAPDAMPGTRPGVFGFNDHDRHAAPDPDLGWNLPS